MWSTALLSAAASFPACAALHQQKSAAAMRGPVRVALDNVGDMTFTASVRVSGEVVHPIMDTGSFDLVLFEHGCIGCSGDSTYFSRKKVGRDFKDLGIEAQQGYGSGTAYTSAVQSDVSLEGMRAGKQVFWLAHDVDMNMYLDDSFGGVFGLGPPASSLASVAGKLAAAEEWIESLTESEQEQYQDTLHSMREVLILGKDQKPWLHNAGVNKFSVCLLPGSGHGGVLVLNDDVSDSNKWVKVSGEYWQIELASGSIGNTTASSCTAVVDSGTSLIGVPSDFLASVELLVEEFDDKYGCQDLSQWPTFKFVLQDGQTLSLDPSSYVAEFDMYSQFTEHEDSNAQAAIQRVKKLMPHLERALQRQRGRGVPGTVCAPAMFSMDAALEGPSSSECLFLVGVPIFREYYVGHRINDFGRSRAMLFARGDSGCKIMDQANMHEARKPVGPLKVDPKKIRIPSQERLNGLNGRHARLSLEPRRK